jgi:TPR repeat protein
MPAAQFFMGLAYLRGDGVPSNYVEACKWFHLASKQGDEDAKEYLRMVREKLTPEEFARAEKLVREFEQKAGVRLNGQEQKSPHKAGF